MHLTYILRWGGFSPRYRKSTLAFGGDHIFHILTQGIFEKEKKSLNNSSDHRPHQGWIISFKNDDTRRIYRSSRLVKVDLYFNRCVVNANRMIL